MIQFEDPPWPELPDARKPVDLAEPRYTLAIILCVCVGSALAGWAAYLLLS